MGCLVDRGCRLVVERAELGRHRGVERVRHRVNCCCPTAISHGHLIGDDASVIGDCKGWLGHRSAAEGRCDAHNLLPRVCDFATGIGDRGIQRHLRAITDNLKRTTCNADTKIGVAGGRGHRRLRCWISHNRSHGGHRNQICGGHCRRYRLTGRTEIGGRGESSSCIYLRKAVSTSAIGCASRLNLHKLVKVRMAI